MAGADSEAVRGIDLEPGAQLSYPVNLDGYLSARTFATHGRPVSFLKSNVNANLGLTYTQTPSLLNGALNQARSVGVNGRLFVGSNVSERVDFTLSYGLGYTTVSNTTAAARDGDYLQHRGGLRLNLLPWGGLSLQSDLDLSYYAGLSDTVDPLTALWNVGVGYKFMQADRAELRLTVADLLNQNASVGRTVTGTYVEDREAQGLGRYVMLNRVYQLRQFGR